MPGPAAPSPLDQAVRLHQSGQVAEALRLYQKLLKASPRDADLLGLMGTAACQLGNLEAGVAWFGKALEVAPEQPKVLFNRGAALLRLGRCEEALASYDQVVALQPGAAEAWSGRGAALHRLGRLEAALDAFQRALALRPAFPEAHTNLGNLHKDLGQYDAALASYQRAIDLQPGYVEAHFNRGNLLFKLRRLDEADASYGRALALNPAFADAHWTRSQIQLMRGDYAQGWRGYEWRWRSRSAGPQRPMPCPQWTGQGDLRGKTLLIHPEQGLGDVLQFARYALLAQAAGACVVVEAPRPLAALLAGLHPDIRVVAEGDPLPPFDLHSPVMSLPMAFRTHLDTVPAPIPYLHADPARVADWQAFLGPRTRPRIGLFWSGNLANHLRAQRSLPTAKLPALLELPFDFHALEKDVTPADAEALHAWPNLHLHPGRSKDFPQTAALMEALDLVVSIDSSIAHLAGALGRPTWILLPFAPDFRWMLDRADTPWYPTARLFRQPSLEDWDGLLAEVSSALQAWARVQ